MNIRRTWYRTIGEGRYKFSAFYYSDGTLRVEASRAKKGKGGWNWADGTANWERKHLIVFDHSEKQDA